MVAINSGDELADILNKALQIEMGFESTSIWEGYIEMKTTEMRDLLFTLSSESHEHTKLIEDILEMIKIESGRKSLPLQDRNFHFSNMKDQEILNELLKYDRLALDIYNGIKEAIEESGSSTLLKEGHQDEFFSILDHLISDEKKHVALIERYVGNIERIR
ncbi:MAG: hypothetical protein GKC03_02545 [Methanomassiliicoccales archaeon]|nr:hypothetical protein [Methanomassiliicoccales archaeon]NYT14915.1 hypothetical protein [Methanomassiliicoccales archaeon]